MYRQWPAIERIIDAGQLRRFSDLSRAKTTIEKEDAVLREHILFEQQKKIFINSEFLESDFETLELRILDAAKQGKYGVEVIKFRAAFCSDGGRAINNHEKDWPQTLQGKASSFHSIWKQHGQPNGYRLKATIINFPGGIPGDVSLSIDWS
ncbi:MAG: histidine kinase [Rhodospirillales bacterium]|nr:histidine kinase [Rhodospirillales bacterium]